MIFFTLLSRSGILIAGTGALGPLPAWAQLAHPAASTGGTSYAFNPISPYLNERPLPWPAPPPTPAPQNFDLLYWTSSDKRGGPGRDDTFGQISFQSSDSGFRVDRETDLDSLTAQFQCANDAWRTPQSWTIKQKPKQTADLDLTATINGSFDDQKVMLGGRAADTVIAQPLTTLAALAGSTAVLEHAAQAGGTFHALNDDGLLLGPLQAKAEPPLLGDDGQPAMKIVVIWGPRIVPTHIIYDSAGTVAQTGFLVSFVRKSLA